MPIYVYECELCGAQQERYCLLIERDQMVPCKVCNSDSRFILSFGPKNRAVYPFVDNYMDTKPVKIESLGHYRKELKKRNLIETGRRRGMKGQWV